MDNGFKKSDKTFFTANKIITTLIWLSLVLYIVLIVVQFRGNIMMLIIFLVVASLVFSTVLAIKNLIFAYLYDVKMIRNKLYNIADDKFSEKYTGDFDDEEEGDAKSTIELWREARIRKNK